MHHNVRGPWGVRRYALRYEVVDRSAVPHSSMRQRGPCIAIVLGKSRRKACVVGLHGAALPHATSLPCAATSQGTAAERTDN
jgi:hypothetical protein